jgi:ribosomal protein S27E
VMVFRGAGDVVRCPACGSVLIVIVSSSGEHRISFESLRWLSFERVSG